MLWNLLLCTSISFYITERSALTVIHTTNIITMHKASGRRWVQQITNQWLDHDDRQSQ